MVGSGNENPIERELAVAIEQSSVQGDYGANECQRDNYRIFAQENEPLRQNEVRQFFENFTSEFNLRLSQEMDSMMSMVHSQINRAINTAISERVIPEIPKIVSSMSSSGNRDTEASMSPCSQENRANPSGLRSKITKKDSRSVGDLRDTAASGHYTYLPSVDRCQFYKKGSDDLPKRNNVLKNFCVVFWKKRNLQVTA